VSGGRGKHSILANNAAGQQSGRVVVWRNMKTSWYVELRRGDNRAVMVGPFDNLTEADIWRTTANQALFVGEWLGLTNHIMFIIRSEQEVELFYQGERIIPAAEANPDDPTALFDRGMSL
jgi:hypothetical protein